MRYFKRLFALLLVLLTVLSLAACKGSEGSDASTASPSDAIGEASLPVADTTEETFSEDISTDSDGIAKLDIPMDEYEGTAEVRFSDGTAFIVYYVAGLDSASATVVTYSLSDSKRLGALELGDGEWNIKVQMGKLFAYNGFNCTVGVYDKELNVLKEPCAIEELAVSSGYFDYAVSADTEYILFYGSYSVLHKFSDGTSELLEDLSFCDAYAYGGGFVVLLNSDNGVYSLDIPDCGLTYCGDKRIVNINAPYLTEVWDDGIIYGVIGADKRYVITQTTEAEYIVFADEGVLVTVAEGIYRIYDLEYKRLHSIALGDEAYGYAFDDGYFFAATDNGVTVLSLEKHDSVICEIVEADDETDIHGWYEKYEDSESEQVAARVLENYGVRIILKSQRLNGSIFEYSFTSAEDDDLLPFALAVEDFLKTLPDGMTSEIADGEEIWVFPCRNITKADENLGGFASLLQTTPFVVVDSALRGEAFVAVLAHEFAHIFNYKLSEFALEKWLSYTPDYYGDTGTDYTPYADDKSSVWFVTSYARTNDEEDRAETFAAMYTYAYCGKKADGFEYTNVLRKAKVYASLLRQTYKSCENAEYLYWEKLFQSS